VGTRARPRPPWQPDLPGAGWSVPASPADL